MNCFKDRRTAIRLLLIGGVAVGGAWSPSSAQMVAPASAAQPPASDQGIAEIVVTATRRETRFQETPVSLTAFSGEQLQRSRIQNAEDIIKVIPNSRLASISQEGSFPQIRGSVTTDYSAGVDRPIAVFVDDIYFSSGTSFLNALFDVGQVQVLRGPQGTTFGRNVTGGAFVVNNRAPQAGQSAAISLTARSNPGFEASGFVNGELVADKLFGRFSFDSRHVEGTVHDIAKGSKTGGIEIDSVRGQLLWTLDADTRLRIGASYIRDVSPARNFQFKFSGNITPTLMSGFPTDPDKANEPVSSSQNTTSAFGFINIQHEASWASITSISAYRYGRIRSRVGISTPTPSFIGRFPTTDHQLSQEVRLASLPGFHRIEWIAGIYYLNLHSVSSRNYTFSPVLGSVISALQMAGPESTQAQDIRTVSLAPYAEALLHITDKFGVRAGARYTTEKKKGNSAHFGTLGVVVNPVYFVNYSERFNAFTPRIIIEYKQSSNIFAYASISRGFKGGGFSVYALKPQDAMTPTDPERVTNYEAGVKTSFFDRRLTFNTSIYYAKTKDLQVSVINPISNSFTLTNAAGSRSKGFEVELVAKPISVLTLQAVYGYLDAKYTKFPRCQGTIDCTGNTPPYTPKQTLSLSGRYEQPLANGASIYASVQTSFSSKTQLNPVNSAYPQSVLDTTDIHGLTDVSVGWILPSGNVELQLWGKNITNERAVIAASDLSVYVYTPAQFAAGGRAYRVIHNEGPSGGATLKWRL